MPSTGLVERVNRLASRAARWEPTEGSSRRLREVHVLRALDALLLEDRILLNAAPIDAATIDTPGTIALIVGDGAEVADAGAEDVPAADDGLQAAEVFHEIAFVDPSAGDAQQFLTDLAKQIEDGRQIEVVLLDGGRDGLEQITDILTARAAEGLPELDAVHIIAHGNERSVRLGSEWLRVDSFEAHQDEFAAWDAALADGGDVLFYSCDLAATDAGQAMLQAVSLAVGGDVAASTDDTGAASLGGDWTLEFSTGTIEASLAVSAEVQDAYAGLLATFTVTNTNNSGAGSLRQAILDANASAGADIIDFNIPTGDAGHLYYRDDGIAGSLSLVAATSLADGAIADFDPDYPAAPYSWYSISLSSALPVVTDAVTIDGTTQPGFSLFPIIELDGNGLVAHGLDIRAGGTTIQGLVINQFVGSGIQVTTGDGNVIQGNFIGTDVSGTIDRGNAIDGIDVRTDNNTIGGTTALTRNVISGNEDDGIDLDAAFGNFVLGNYIGVDVTGTRLLGNSSDGILIENSSDGNTIGGMGAGEGNVIAGNAGHGVSVVGNSDGNPIRGNSIYSNAGLGIDLENNGVTTNDVNDVDAGANNQQNLPVITAVLTNANMTTISGTLHSTASGTFDLDFYASGVADGSGHGEGQTYLGSGTVITDGSGNGSFTIILSSGVGSGAVITSTATDASGNTSEFSATIIAASANNSPVLDNTGGMTLTDVAEDDPNPAGDTVAAIVASAGGDRITDADAGALEGIAVLGVDDTNGQWQYDAGSGWIAFGAVSNNSAVLLDSAARIRFVPNANYNGPAGNITFRAWDQTDGNTSGDTGVDVSTNGGMTAYSTEVETATVVVNAVNDAPVLDNTGTMTLTDIGEDDTASAGDTVGSIIASAGGDRITDLDSGAVEGIAVTGVNNANGQWQYNTGSGWLAFGSISDSSAVLLDMTVLIRFVPNADYNGSAGDIAFRAWDQTDGNASGDTGIDVSTNGGTTAYSAATETATLDVNPVNDAPVLDSSGSMTLTPINEDDLTSTGDTVAAIVATAGGDRITDADVGAMEGIAVVGVDDSNGQWQYDVGGGWIAFGAVSDNTAVLLDTSARIRFVPTANYSGSAGNLTFRAWDQTDGNASGDTSVDVSTNGGATAYSTATETATLAVNAVNDAPLLDNTGTMTLADISEDDTTAAGDTVGSIIASAGGDRITDIDSGAVEGIAVTGVDNTNGQWQFNTGSGWVAFGAVSSNNGVLLDAAARIRFVPSANYNGPAGDITFRAWDQTDGNASGDTGIDVSTSGGTTAYSSAAETATLTVTAVNDAPVNSAPGSQTTSEDSPLTLSAANGNAISVSDADAGANPVEVSLSVTNGRLTLAQTTGLVFSTGDGAADATLTFTGTLSDVNAALNGLRYDPNLNYSGPDVLSIVTNDLGNSGGAPLSDGDAVAITVTFVGSQPVAQNDTARLFGAPSLFMPTAGVLANDYDVDGQPLSAVLVSAPPNGSVTLNADGSFTYAPTPGFYGYDTFRYAAYDGILTSAPATVTVLVVPGIVAPPAGGGGGEDTDDGGEFAGTSPDGGQPDAAEPDEQEEDSSSSDQYVGSSPDGGSSASRRFARLIGGEPETVESDESQTDLLVQNLLLRTAQIDGDAAGMFRTASLVAGATSGGVGGIAAGHGTLAALSQTLQFDAGILFDRLDQLEDAVDRHAQTLEWIVGSAAATTTVLTSGYVFWLLRGGYLFAGMLSSMPAWYRFDPLPVLQNGGAFAPLATRSEDDSLEEFLGDAKQRTRSKVPGEPGATRDPIEAEAK